MAMKKFEKNLPKMEDFNPETLRMQREQIIEFCFDKFWVKTLALINTKIIKQNLHLQRQLIICLDELISNDLILGLYGNIIPKKSETKNHLELTSILNIFEEKLNKYYTTRDFSISRLITHEDKLTFTYLIEW